MPPTDEQLAPDSFTITVFTRHSSDCPKKDNPQWKRCNCRKSLYIRENGKTKYRKANTRSWEQAEKVAQAERDKRDPVKKELQKIAEQEAEKERLKSMPLSDALDQWLGGKKDATGTSVAAYRSTVRKILRWAKANSVELVSDVTPLLLETWRNSWDEDSDDPELRMKPVTQSVHLTRLKSFFAWATAVRIIDHDPTSLLKPIGPGDSPTHPLTPSQFNDVLEATKNYDQYVRYRHARVGEHLRAVFLVQRWTGLRIGDALMLPKSALHGNRLSLVMQKVRRPIECVVPDQVVEALMALPLCREIHPDYFFWSKKCRIVTNTNKWVRKVRMLNEWLTLENDHGEPMKFRSHMLRDTFAVEMLLGGMPMEKVSRLLGHKSVSITERYYAKWVKSRLRQLEDETVETMKRMGATFGQTQGGYKHGLVN